MPVLQNVLALGIAVSLALLANAVPAPEAAPPAHAVETVPRA